MVLFAFAALTLSSGFQEPSWDDSELRIQERLRSLGCSMSWVSEGDKPELAIDVDNKERSFDFSNLKGLKRLYALRVFQGKIDESSLKSLVSLKNLHLLVILSDGLTDKGVRSISKFPAVDKLDIKCSRLTGEGLKSMAKMTSMRRLFLYNTAITDQDTKPLEAMTWLSQLVLPESVSLQECGRLQGLMKGVSITRME